MIYLQCIITVLSWWSAYLFTEKSNLAPFIGALAQVFWIIVLSSFKAWPLLLCETGFFIIYMRACVLQMRVENGTN